MKNLILLFTLITTSLFAQTGINYQGAATNSDGAKLANQNISLKTSVLQGGADGTTSYSETHNTTTDQFGLFNVVIGQGESISGDFETISWGSGDHFLKVELDATGGTNYNLVSTTQMMSVPYALYAKNAGIDSAMVAEMIGTNTSSGSFGDWELLYSDININSQTAEPFGDVNRYGTAQFDGFLHLIGPNLDIFTGFDHDTINDIWPEGYLNRYHNGPNSNLILIPVKKDMSWHIRFHSSTGHINNGYFIPKGGGTASLANDGMSGTSKSFKYPDGMNGTPITWHLPGNDYVVPEGKNLYITSHNGNSTGMYLQIDGIEMMYDGNGQRFLETIIVGSGSIISTSSTTSGAYSNFNGILVDANVTPITWHLPGNDYVVPEGKNLYITAHNGNSTGMYLQIDGIEIMYDGNGHRFLETLIVGSGSIISTSSTTSSAYSNFNGYLADLDYFESPSSSSASNSGGGANTMDISVSQYGDTLFGLGNDFLIIPGLSVANQHMQFNQYGSVTDIDGNTYKTLVYGDNEWMIENLRTNIGNYITNTDAGSMFPNNLTFTDSIGYYYTYETSQSDICPSGWHIPTLQEWQDFHLEVFGETLELTAENGALFTSENYNSLWSTHLNDGNTNQSFFNLFQTGSIWTGNGGNFNIMNDKYASFWVQNFYYINGNSSVCEINFGGLSASNPWSILFYCQNYSNGGDHKQIRCIKD